jgi:hypothetical protein
MFFNTYNKVLCKVYCPVLPMFFVKPGKYDHLIVEALDFGLIWNQRSDQ